MTERRAADVRRDARSLRIAVSRSIAEAARKARDEAWQASLREIGQRHKETTDVAVSGFKDALDRHDRMLDRFSAQNDRLVGDMTSVKTDVAILRTDVHAVVTKLTTLDGIKPM